MNPHMHRLGDNLNLIVRQAAPNDAEALLDYIEAISAESDYLTFGPGEFVLSVSQEEAILRGYQEAENQIYLLAFVDDEIVASLTFSASRRPRLCHSGEISMSVRKAYWGQGIGGLILDAAITWARNNQVIKKINLQVRTDNRRAVRLYIGRGFIIEGTIRKEIFLDRQYFDLYWMGLIL